MAKRKRSPVVFNRQRTLELCQTIIRSWQERSLDLNGLNGPETILPDTIVYGTREHACFLFSFGWANIYGNKALAISEACLSIYQEAPWAVDPACKDVNDDAIEAAVMPAIPFSKKKAGRAKWWVECRQIIRDEFGSDPRNIFLLHGSSRAEFLRALERFPGIGHKIAQLTGIWFQDVTWEASYLNLMRESRWEKFQHLPLVPVDMWVMRILFQCGAVKRYRTDSHSVISRPISDYLSQLCAEHHLSCSDLSQGFWHTGSQICFRRPKHQRHPEHTTAYCVVACPVHDLCLATIHQAGVAYKKQGAIIGEGKLVPRHSLFTPRQK